MVDLKSLQKLGKKGAAKRQPKPTKMQKKQQAKQMRAAQRKLRRSSGGIVGAVWNAATYKKGDKTVF